MSELPTVSEVLINMSDEERKWLDEILTRLYHDVERRLSWILQTSAHESVIAKMRATATARDDLRTIMRKMGYTGQF